MRPSSGGGALRPSSGLAHLRRGCDGHVDWLLPFVDVSPMFDAIRGHPDYRSLGECLPPEARASR
ncbi:MAG: hypothetical protein AAGF23_11530 [Acidobacteriota bacterium]